MAVAGAPIPGNILLELGLLAIRGVIEVNYQFWIALQYHEIFYFKPIMKIECY